MASNDTNTAGDFSDPSSGGNFLERYRAARATTSPSTTAAAAPASPPTLKPSTSPPRSPSGSKTQAVWSSTFHPLGRSAKSASRYDSAAAPGTGSSTSEMLEKKAKTISLDGKALED